MVSAKPQAEIDVSSDVRLPTLKPSGDAIAGFTNRTLKPFLFPCVALGKFGLRLPPV